MQRRVDLAGTHGDSILDWHSDDDLERLDAALMALPEENEPMLLTEFDGFCAGLITCPDMIPPSVWLGQVWGPGGLPEFENLSDMQALLDLVTAHYNRVAVLLMQPGAYYPVLDEDRRNGDVLWEFWMMGFVAARRFRPEAWNLIRESDDARAKRALRQMDDLGRIAINFSEGEVGKPGRLAKRAPELIPDLVEDLNVFAKSRMPRLPPGFPLAANIASAPASFGKTGRNDSCPCGSGRKYKKCCGAAVGPVH